MQLVNEKNVLAEAKRVDKEKQKRLELEELIYLKKYLEISVIIDWFTNDFFIGIECW